MSLGECSSDDGYPHTRALYPRGVRRKGKDLERIVLARAVRAHLVRALTTPPVLAVLSRASAPAAANCSRSPGPDFIDAVRLAVVLPP